MSAASAAVRGKEREKVLMKEWEEGEKAGAGGECVLSDGKNTQCAHRTGSSELPGRVSSDPTTDLNAPD